MRMELTAEIWQRTKEFFMSDTERLTALKAKLAARRNMPGYEANVKELEREIAKLEQPKP